ncbi:hypothetical protein HCAN_0738 [Helicobacter canadensis MIT 98-5491]|uniref:Uncharacterized protein n=1 Tax=Helicobacter canadensis MIT 98-5491 TaxID=537970 RepID=C5ZWD4_9HELI|nr:hypothetical protein HCAN_0738 [Helicobacter canadensis MIT 98-5491]
MVSPIAHLQSILIKITEFFTFYPINFHIFKK